MREYFESKEYNEIGSSEFGVFTEYATVSEYGESGEEQFKAEEFSDDNLNNPFIRNVDRVKKIRKSRQRMSLISAFVMAVGAIGVTAAAIIQAAVVRVSGYTAYDRSLEFEYEIIGYENCEFLATLTTYTEEEKNRDPHEDEPYIDDWVHGGFPQYYYADAVINREEPRTVFLNLEPDTVYLLQVFKMDFSRKDEHRESELMLSRTYSTGSTAGEAVRPELRFENVVPGPNTLEFAFECTYSDISELRAELDGTPVDISAGEEGKAYVYAEGLEENTEHNLKVYRIADGELLADVDAATSSAGTLIIRQISVLAGTDSITLQFEVTGSESHNIRVESSDGSADAVRNGSELNVSITGLPSDYTEYDVSLYDDFTDDLAFRGTYRTEALPLSIAYISGEISENTALMVFSANDPGAHGFSAEMADGAPASVSAGQVSEDGQFELSVTGLSPLTTYTVVFRDSVTGNKAYEYSFVTGRPTAVVQVVNVEPGLSTVSMTVNVENPYGIDVSASMAGQTMKLDGSGGMSFSFGQLEEGTEYSYEIKDGYGEVLASGTATTLLSETASVSVTRQSVNCHDIALLFDVSNPDGHELSVTVNGRNTDFTYDNGTMTLSLSGLDDNAAHEIAITDNKKSEQIFLETFTTPLEPSATVTLASSSIDCFNIGASLSVSNPYGHTLRMTVDGRSVDYTTDISFTDLSPRTSRSVVVTDAYTGARVFNRTFKTDSSVTFTQNRLGKVSYTINDSFIAKYPGCSVTLTAPDGYPMGTVYLEQQSTTTGVEDEEYLVAGKYTVRLTTRQVCDEFQQEFSGLSWCTFDVSRTDSSLTFTLKSGTLPSPRTNIGTDVPNEYCEMYVWGDDGYSFAFNTEEGSLTLGRTMSLTGAAAVFPQTGYYEFGYSFWSEDVQDNIFAVIGKGSY